MSQREAGYREARDRKTPRKKIQRRDVARRSLMDMISVRSVSRGVTFFLAATSKTVSDSDVIGFAFMSLPP